MGYNYAMFGLAPYGDYWRQVRKIITLEVLSQRRVEMLGHVRESELKASLKDIHEAWENNKESAGSNMVKVDMKQWFGTLVLNIVVRVISGKRFPTNDEEGIHFQNVIRKKFELLGAFVASDYIPYMDRFDLGGYEKEMMLVWKEMDNIMDGWLQEHMREIESGQQLERNQVFLDVLISSLQGAPKEDFPGFDHDTVIKASCLALITAGLDTTSVTLTWVLSLLLNNPKALKAVQEEIDEHVGRNRPVEESDVKNLFYLEAVIKETLRLYPAGPLAVPHESMEDCVLSGYNVPKGTRLLINLWKLQRDPNIWPDPDEFKPERFMTTDKHIDVKGKHYELLPFGSGRRMCPGVFFALQALHLTLATVIQQFELVKPSDEQIDMSESSGLTTSKATPLEVLLSPRSSLNTSSKNNRPPAAAGAWPIVGHFNLFGGLSDPLHKILGSMAVKYGPIFTIQLGVRQVLVVNSWDIAKEIFTTHDAIISSRPKFTAAKILGYNYAMFGVSPYGPYWREMRKITSLELLSARRLEQLKHVRVSELKNSIKNLYELWSEKRDGQGKALVVMNKWFGELNMNVMLRMVVGKRLSGATSGEEDEMNKFRVVVREFFDFLGLFVVADTLPFLGWLDLGGHEKAMKRVAKEIDFIIGKWLAEHRAKRDSTEAMGEKDFLDVMISAVETGDLGDYNADTIIKSTCLDIIASSVDTITVMLTWTLSLLLNNPDALKKAQEEIDKHVAKDRQVEDSDIDKLVYLQAIVKETLRLYPAAPLGAPREFSNDCTVAGYHVPKGTWLMVNISSLQRDAEIWSEPSEFMPERFLTETHMHVDFRGRNFELIPFGAGRRYCPGIAFSTQMLHIVLATLLHNFDMSVLNDEPVDMTESVGLINAKASPLEVQIVPRPVAGNQIARRVIDDLINFSGETSVRNYMKFFFEQQISKRRQASVDPSEVFDTLFCLRDDVRDEQARLGVLDYCITQAEEHIEIKEEHVRVMEAEANDVRVYHPAPVVSGILCGCYHLEFGEGTSFFLDKLSEVAESPSMGDKMKYLFGRSRSEEESLGSLMCNLCSALRVSVSNKRRLVAELEALGEVEGAAKSLEHMRTIVGRDAVTLGELEALWARAQVGAALKAGFVADMEVQE
ncbi:cytochrome P450 [Tanacetum coccineum]